MTIHELRTRGDRTHVKDEGPPDNPLGKIPRHERKEGGINNTKEKRPTFTIQPTRLFLHSSTIMFDRRRLSR
jgi:hypothetical protein